MDANRLLAKYSSSETKPGGGVGFGLGTLDMKNSASGFPHSSQFDTSMGFSCLQYLQNFVVGMTSTAFLPHRPQKEQNDPQLLIVCLSSVVGAFSKTALTQNSIAGGRR